MSQSGPPADAKQAQAVAIQELEAAQRRKRQIDTSLANLEASIYAFEGSYLEETAQSGGNIIKGFDNYLKPPAAGVHKKKMEVGDGDRLFSTSSGTFQQSLNAKRQYELEQMGHIYNPHRHFSTPITQTYNLSGITNNISYANGGQGQWGNPPSAILISGNKTGIRSASIANLPNSSATMNGNLNLVYGFTGLPSQAQVQGQVQAQAPAQTQAQDQITNPVQVEGGLKITLGEMQEGSYQPTNASANTSLSTSASALPTSNTQIVDYSQPLTMNTTSTPSSTSVPASHQQPQPQPSLNLTQGLNPALLTAKSQEETETEMMSYLNSPQTSAPPYEEMISSDNIIAFTGGGGPSRAVSVPASISASSFGGSEGGNKKKRGGRRGNGRGRGRGGGGGQGSRGGTVRRG